MEIIFRLLKNDAFFPQEISRTSQTYRRQNHSACPTCCAFLSCRARLPWHAQKMCAVTIVGPVLNSLNKKVNKLFSSDPAIQMKLYIVETWMINWQKSYVLSSRNLSVPVETAVMDMILPFPL